MVLVDTSIWIEFFRGKDPYYTNLSILLADRQVVGAACVFGELLQGARNNKEIELIFSFWQDLPKVPADVFEKAWIIAGKASSKEKWYARGIGVIDATLLALAQENGLKLWSLDAQMMKIAKKYAMDF